MNAVAQTEKKSLVVKFADRYAVDSSKMLDTLKSTAFKQRDGSAPSNEQMMALLVVADQYKLNPFTREIYAFPDKQNGIVPVVGVDGWSRIINSHPQFDGMEFRYSDETTTPPGAKLPAMNGLSASCTARIAAARSLFASTWMRFTGHRSRNKAGMANTRLMGRGRRTPNGFCVTRS